MKSAVLIGEEGLLTLCGNHLLERGWRITAIVTISEQVVSWAKSNKLPIFSRLSEILEFVGDPADYLFSITNFRIIPEPIISWARVDAFNFHDGPLPDVGGLNTPSWAILNHARTHGITWHSLSADVDGGGVCVRHDFNIEPDDTVLDLNARCFELGFDGFQELIRVLENGELKIAPPKHPVKYFGRPLKPKYLGFVDWEDSARNIDALFRSTSYGGYRNGFVTTKILLTEGYMTPVSLTVVDYREAGDQPPGTILDAIRGRFDVQTGNGVVRIGIPELENQETTLNSDESLPDIKSCFPVGFSRDGLGHLHDDMIWISRIKGRQIYGLEHLKQDNNAELIVSKLSHASQQIKSDAEALAALCLLVGRMNETEAVGLAVSTDRLRRISDSLHGSLLPYSPVFADIDSGGASLLHSCQTSLQRVAQDPSMPHELFERIPSVKAQKDNYTAPELIFYVVNVAAKLTPNLNRGEPFSLVFCSEDNSLYLISRADEATCSTLDRWMTTSLSLVQRGLPLLPQTLTDQQDDSLVNSLNLETHFEYVATTIDELVHLQIESKMNEIALCSGGKTCTFGELAEKAAEISTYLSNRQYDEGSLIGVMLIDKIEAVYTMLGILQGGFAYVPLDPTYPSDRLNYIVEDAGLECIFSDQESAEKHGLQSKCVSPDTLRTAESKSSIRTSVDPGRRAYVIYTSGSTGQPKGVQVSHDNVVNFLHGMDQVIDLHEGTMLSVTSISFDISVLEIWWSLTRGIKVVFYDKESTIGEVQGTHADSISFSLYFWNTQDPAAPSSVEESYDMLKKAVKFADDNGFDAVWTPERHFGSFGGPFPNPAITSAALATITERVKIRAGSCVMPLHHPIRVAEDWAVIDNLSHGRVGISFASGWMPRDFVLAPQNHARSKEVMFEGVRQVRALWRGESVSFEGPQGEEQICTLPRPVQKELPTWITTAGSPEVFAHAGKLGLNLLTHLLGQSVSELEKKLKIYRAAWEKAGHPDSGCVTLMLHTFVTTSKEHARRISRGPMKAYLKSAMSLVRAAAWDFPTFKKMSGDEKQDMDGFFANLTEEDLDDLLEFAFHRYFEESGLFGTPEENIEMVEKLKSIGITEIGCLIDFGISPDKVLSNLKYLNNLKSLSSDFSSNSLKAIVDHYSITHMQCTPSQANMFGLNRDDLQGLEKLKYLMVGGEALSQNLADKLGESLSGKVVNMYGPTETTVWSLTKQVEQNKAVMIGLPITNTRVYVLDSKHRTVPVGWPGELYIGGRGVSLGYLNRPELSDDKFVTKDGEEIYATGDYVRMCDDGNLIFLGRKDHQVKIRGYRIELGEVESVLERVSGIIEAVVVGESDQWGESELVAYFTSKSTLKSTKIREKLTQFLPTFMVPFKFVHLNEMPRTLNGKVDRKILMQVPRDKSKPLIQQQPLDQRLKKFQTASVNTTVQKDILEIWQGLLEMDKIDVNANFFDLGGHSILAVRMQGMLSKKFGRRVPISELFRYPTVAGLARHLDAKHRGSKSTDAGLVKEVALRAAKRKARFQ